MARAITSTGPGSSRSSPIHRRTVRGRLESYKYNYSYGGDTTTSWGQFSSVVLKIRRVSYLGDWLMREARLIHRLRPIYNKRGPLSSIVG